ncbi:Transcriptional regulator MexR [Pseudomonas aeruginosa PA1R]|nr:Transcriptional regulator MexR [Pseudomonas aeruginosa PA1R]
MNPDLMPALMAVFQHVRTRIQSELDCQRLDLTPPDVHVLKLIDEQRGLNLQDLGRQMCRDKALITRKIREGKKPGPPRAQPQRPAQLPALPHRRGAGHPPACGGHHVTRA